MTFAVFFVLFGGFAHAQTTPTLGYLQAASGASARSRYSLRSISSYFRVFMNDSQAALTHGLPLRDMLKVMPFTLRRSV